MTIKKTDTGYIIMQDGKVSCDCCGFFYGFDTSLPNRTKYKKMEVFDMDCCSLCDDPPDGTMTILATGIDVGIVISATGNFGPEGCTPRIGNTYSKDTFGVTDSDPGTVFSDTKKNTNQINEACCNPDGDKVWCTLNDIIL